MALHRFPAPRRGACQRGPFSFTKENGPLLIPQEKGFAIASEQLEELQCLPIALPIARRCRVSIAIRFELLLLSAVAQPLAALLPYGCGTPLAGAALPILWECTVISAYRQSLQCGERSNAAFRKQSAAEKTSLAPHDSKARLRLVTDSRDSWRSHVHCTLTAQRVQSFEIKATNVRG